MSNRATKYGLLFIALTFVAVGLFELMRLEQKALVVGAIALFLVLAMVMMLTRKVDWYSRLQRDGQRSVGG